MKTLTMAAAIIILAGSVCAVADAWRNRRKYRTQERKRRAQGGLD